MNESRFEPSDSSRPGGIVEFLATREGSNLRVRILGSTASPDRFQTMEALLTPSDLAANDDALLQALEALFLADEDDGFVSGLTCPLQPDTFPPRIDGRVHETQNWNPEGTLSSGGLPQDQQRVSEFVEVYFVV